MRLGFTDQEPAENLAGDPRHACRFEGYYAIYPPFAFWGAQYDPGEELPPGFRFASDVNEEWLDAESQKRFKTKFVELSDAQKHEICDDICHPAKVKKHFERAARFFSRFRDLTASGFFSSKMGIADLPFLGNKAVAEWKGCDPKTWALIEERMKNGYKGVGGESKSIPA